jgi:protoporphyrinogen IX oxidase
MTELWLKAFHLIFMTSWFAGLFYLPRIFVNLAMVESEKSYHQLLMMAKKLYRFITPFLFLTIGFGSALLYYKSYWLLTGWMQIKLLLVTLLIVYHFVCGGYLKRFENRSSIRSHVFYRWFNEFPVLILFAVVILVVVKPF